jgi:hypothetical protein
MIHLTRSGIDVTRTLMRTQGISKSSFERPTHLCGTFFLHPYFDYEMSDLGLMLNSRLMCWYAAMEFTIG